LVSEPEPLNGFKSIEVIPAATFEEEPLESHFWNNQLVTHFGILTAQTWSEKAADLISMTPYCYYIGQDIPQPTPGFLVILNNLVTARDIIVQELIQQSDPQQQQQQQFNP